jgi:hypothetical protein
MNSKERVKKAFDHEEPDRVPIFEAEINSPVASEILGRPAYVGYGGYTRVKMVAEALLEDRYEAFVRQRTDDYIALDRRLGIDVFHAPPLPNNRTKPEPIDGTTWRYVDPSKGTWSIARYLPESDMGGVVDCNIKQEGFEGLKKEISIMESEGTLVDELYLGELKHVIAQVGHEMFVLGSGIGVRIPLSDCWADVFMMAMIMKPTLAHRYLDLCLERTLALLDRMIEIGVNGVACGIDWAGSTGMIISPAHFREFILPRLKQITARCHQRGLVYIKHTDGNVMAIEKEFFEESGVDGYHPIDPGAGMDIRYVKEKYGRRLTLLGNVDCAHTLVHGSRQEIIDETISVIKKAAPGGGFLLSSSNSIHSGIPAKNYLTMLEAAREYGDYPIAL